LLIDDGQSLDQVLQRLDVVESNELSE
jgi:hypothetical protein